MSLAQFIAEASGQGHEYINHDVDNVASGIRTIRTRHPNDNHPILLVDTPGFDDVNTPDDITLSKIADWLVKR
jgi:hypothetical protein